MSGGGVTPSPTPEPVDYATHVFYRGPLNLVVNDTGAVIVGNYTTKEYIARLAGPYEDPIANLVFLSLAELRESEPDFAAEIDDAIRQYGAQTSYNPMNVQDEMNGTITVDDETITVVENQYTPKLKSYE